MLPQKLEIVVVAPLMALCEKMPTCTLVRFCSGELAVSQGSEKTKLGLPFQDIPVAGSDNAALRTLQVF